MSQHDPRDVRAHDNVHVVPQEMDGMAGLLDAQDGHYSKLAAYAADSCGTTAGLKGLMGLLSGPISDLSDLFVGTYEYCQRRMAVTSGGLRRAKRDFLATDEQSAEELRHPTMFDPPPKGMENVQIPASWRYAFTDSYEHSYEDNWSPMDDPDTSDGKFSNGVVRDVAEQSKNMLDIYAMQKPHGDLIETIVAPISGDYTLLASYKSAYDQLGNSTYQVAENIRKGLVRIGPRWNGDAAAAFEWETLRWSEGTGGLGDTAECASELFGWLYDQVVKYLDKISQKIAEMYAKHWDIREFLERFPGAYEYFRAYGIQCVPTRAPHTGMTESDAVELARLFHEMQNYYVEAFRLVEKLSKLYDDAVKKARTIIGWFSKAPDDGDFSQYVTDSVFQHAQDRVLNYERPHGHEFSEDYWNPRLGAWRLAALPGS